MTIVAGFPGRGIAGINDALGYVVLGADSEEVSEGISGSVRKVESIEHEEYKILLAGAGSSDFIDLAVHEVRKGLTEPFTHESIREQIEEIVTDIYADRIDSYPAHQQDDLLFNLLGAIWVRGDVRVDFIRIRRAVSLVLRRPTTIGLGSELAHYITSNLYFEGMSAYPATRLMVHLLTQLKKFVPDIGGNSQVVVLDGRGEITELLPSTITQHELSSSVVMEGAGKWLFYYADPMATNYNMAAIDGWIDMAAGQLKTDIRQKMGLLVEAQQSAAVSNTTITTEGTVARIEGGTPEVIIEASDSSGADRD